MAVLSLHNPAMPKGNLYGYRYCQPSREARKMLHRESISMQDRMNSVEKPQTPSSQKKAGPSSKHFAPRNCNISPQNVVDSCTACGNPRDQGCTIQVRKMPPKKQPVKAITQAGPIF